MSAKLKTPNKMFTIADTNWVSLLFYAENGDNDPQKIMQALRRHPVFAHTCNMGVVIPAGTPDDLIEVSGDIESDLRPDEYLPTDIALGSIKYKKGSPRLDLDFKQILFDCKLPHKTMGGCLECFNLNTPYVCDAKKAHRNMSAAEKEYYVAGTDYTSPQYLLPLLINRKTKVGDYTYISPALTKTNPFQPTLRPPEDHDFTEVSTWSSIRQDATREATRIRQFKKTECSRCLYREPCETRCESHEVQGCPGPYVNSPGHETPEDEILATTFTEYSPVQLNNLLKHYAGPLPFLVDRKQQSFTCKVEHSELVFGLVRITYKPERAGEFTPLHIDDVMKLCLRLRKHKPKLPLLGEGEPLPKNLQALLIELATISHSPTRYGIWHQTPYEPLYIRRETKWCDELKVFYRFNTYRKEHGSWETPWGFSARTLGDVYEYYGKLESLKKTLAPLRAEYSEYRR